MHLGNIWFHSHLTCSRWHHWSCHSDWWTVLVSVTTFSNGSHQTSPRDIFVIIRILKCTYKFKWSPSGLHPWTNSIFITYPILLNSFKSIFCHCRWYTAVRQTTSTATSGNLSLPLTNWMSQTDTVWVWQLLWGEPLHQPSISNIKSSDKNLGITFDKHLNLTYQSFSQLYVFNLKRCKNETFNGFQSFGSLSSTKL